MRKKWPVCALVVVLCMVMLCRVPAYAAKARASDRIYHSTATLSKVSNGDLSICFSVRGKGKMDVIGASSAAIRRKAVTGGVRG